MRLISRRTVIEYGEKHPVTAASLQHWIDVVRAADWKSPADVQAAFSKVKILKGDRARFEINGGDFRLIAAIAYEDGIVFVKFIGTHTEYDRIDDVETYNLFGPDKPKKENK